jgi:hypothetical protein
VSEQAHRCSNQTHLQLDLQAMGKIEPYALHFGAIEGDEEVEQ